MASNEASVEDLGYVKLIDPNPPDRGIDPPEDLFIYVSLKAYSKNRSVIINEDGDNTINTENSVQNNEVNFIATRLDTNSDDNVSYATTDYTDIGGLNIEENRGGAVEGFGIKNIDITYNSSLVPVVKITFEDVRGAALFDVIDRENRESPYSLFFKMPYPTFNLTVKGYYGRPVSYCLHMINWTSSFNTDSGNFEINADFIGFQSAFISDINMQHVIAVTETDAAKERLKELKIKNFEGNESPTPTLREFLGDISKLQIGLNELKAGNDGFKNLKNINTAFSLIKSLSNLIGKPLRIINEKKDPDKFRTEVFSSRNFNTNDNIISVRDIIVIKEADRGYFNTFIEAANRLKKEYDKFQKESKLGQEFEIKEYILNNPDNVPEVVIKNDNNNFSGFTNDLYEEGTDVWKISTDNSDFNITGVSGFDTKEKFIEKYKDSFTPATKVLVYDFSAMRENINQIEIDLKERVKDEKDKLSKELNKELSKKIKFNPNIRNIFSIIMNNVQAMLETLYYVSDSADKKGRERLNALDSDDTDVVGDHIFPWPSVYKNDENGELKQVWLNTVTNEAELFPEIQFVDEAIEGYTKASEELKQYRKVVKDLRNPNSLDNWLSINIMDYETNPYFMFNSPNKWNPNGTTSGVPNELYTNVVERAITLKNFSNVTQTSYNRAYPYLEGAIATTNIVSQNYLDIVGDNFNTDDAIKAAEKANIIRKSGNNYILNEVSLDDKIYFKVGQKIKPIINNKSRLVIKSDEDYDTRFDLMKPQNTEISKGIFYQDRNNLYRHNISYLVWDETTKNKIKTDENHR